MHLRLESGEILTTTISLRSHLRLRYRPEACANVLTQNIHPMGKSMNALRDEHRKNPVGDLIGRQIMGWLTLRF